MPKEEKTPSILDLNIVPDVIFVGKKGILQDNVEAKTVNYNNMKNMVVEEEGDQDLNQVL